MYAASSTIVNALCCGFLTGCCLLSVITLQVASFMRAVLRTLAQCHSHHILHRDIKPGNFMLLDDSDRSPLKAIDFGLAMPFNPDNLPMKDLGLEGTPW